MNIAIRVDASLQIGTGHLMRCLTLANELKSYGCQVCFLSRHMPEYLKNLIAEKGYEFLLLNSLPETLEVALAELPHSAWLQTTQRADAEEVIKNLEHRSIDCLIVDHYALDKQWESALRKCVDKIFVIDDLADRCHDCDFLLDQNLYHNMHARYSNMVLPYCRLLLGPRYSLLRSTFRENRPSLKVRKRAVKRVLISFGGMDINNNTGQALRALQHIDIKNLKVDVIIGAQHPAREQIEAECLRKKFTCYVQTDKMADLINEADIAIGAGGVGVWERCCLGLPTITFSTASNQDRQIQDAAAEGLIYLPSIKDVEGGIYEAICQHLPALMNNNALRHFISHRGLEIVDGQGAQRVSRIIVGTSIEMRKALPQDSENIYKWRNHESIRGVSTNTDVIPWTDHQAWFSTVLGSDRKILLIGEVDGNSVGVVRFDIVQNQAEVSIYMTPNTDHWVKGSDLLKSSENWIMKNCPNINMITAKVIGDNISSHYLFKNAHYLTNETRYFKRLV